MYIICVCLEHSRCNLYTGLWSTPDVQYMITSGVLQMYIVWWHLEYSRCTLYDDIWSTPDVHSGVNNMPSSPRQKACLKQMHASSNQMPWWKIRGNLRLDLRKVKCMSGSSNRERTPIIVGGKVERFCDIGTMIDQWEEMEGNVLEWKVEEWVRRGGRKVSRRISELLGKFRGKKKFGRTGQWF